MCSLDSHPFQVRVVSPGSKNHSHLLLPEIEAPRLFINNTKSPPLKGIGRSILSTSNHAELENKVFKDRWSKLSTINVAAPVVATKHRYVGCLLLRLKCLDV